MTGFVARVLVTGVGVLLWIGLAGCGSSGVARGHASATSSAPNAAPSSAPPPTSATTAAPAATTPTTPGAPPVSVAAPGSCHASGSGLYVLPDPACTPGITNPKVSQANISSTICARGWTETIRPPESYTESLKVQQMAAYGDTGRISSYEEDHLIPLELGGSPTSPANLWPEPGASPNPKDAVEDAANRAVCNGEVTLTDAQQAIAANWIALGQKLGAINEPGASSPPAAAGPSATTAPLASAATSSSSPASPGPGAAFCLATAAPSNDGYPGDYQVSVSSNQPDQNATASDAGDTWSEDTDSAGSADIRLYNTSPGETITVTVGAASCSTSA
jgi:hypothetical protein